MQKGLRRVTMYWVDDRADHWDSSKEGQEKTATHCVFREDGTVEGEIDEKLKALIDGGYMAICGGSGALFPTMKAYNYMRLIEAITNAKLAIAAAVMCAFAIGSFLLVGGIAWLLFRLILFGGKPNGI